MANDETRVIELSVESYELLMGQGRFPETVDDLIVRLINGHAPKTQHNLPGPPIEVTPPAPKKRTQKRKKRTRIGCEYCNRVFLANAGYSSHLRHFHPEHYNPKNPIPLNERKTVIYRTADGKRRQMRVSEMQEEIEREA